MGNLIEIVSARPGYYGALLGVSFCAGAAAGLVAEKVKEKIEEKVHERRKKNHQKIMDNWFETAKEFGYDDGTEEQSDVTSKAVMDHMDRVISENYTKPDITDYTKFFQNAYDGEPLEEKPEDEVGPNCSIVEEEDYLATDIPGYAKADGTYFVKDKVLAGWNDKLAVQDIESTVGSAAIEKLEQEDISTIYVRNATIKVDYQITKSDASYEEAVAEADI